jgi:hypothetical protein
VASAKRATKAGLVGSILALVAGLQANFSPTDTLDLPSGTYTIDQLTQLFLAYVAILNGVASASQAFHLAVEKEQSVGKSTLAVRSQVKAVIESRVGKTSTAMTTYGFAPAKVPVHTPGAKVAAAAKAKSTREVRGTKGSKQKEAITGNVTGVTVTPIVAPGAASPEATPATTGTTSHS